MPTKAATPENYHEPALVKRIPAMATKVIDEDKGIVEEFFSITGNIDHGKDRLWLGSFTKTIQERGNRVLVLDQHNTDSILRVIGKPISIREVGKNELPIEIRQRFPDATGGILAKTQYLLDTPEGLGAFQRIKAGAIKELSFGFDIISEHWSTIKAKKTDDGWQLDENGDEIKVRDITEVRLYEYSRVLWGMNPATATVSVKSDDPPAPPAEDTPPKVDKAKLSKSVNLTRLISEIEGEFMETFNPPDECMYWPIEVYDDHLIVCTGYGRERAFYQVNFTASDTGAITFAPRQQWIEGSYQFAPKQPAQAPAEDQPVYDETDETESGLTAAQQVAAALKTITDLLPGLLENQPETKGAPPAAEPAPVAAHDAQTTTQTINEAGPVAPPTEAERTKRLAIEKQKQLQLKGALHNVS